LARLSDLFAEELDDAQDVAAEELKPEGGMQDSRAAMGARENLASCTTSGM
jgi:hypothetical protein